MRDSGGQGSQDAFPGPEVWKGVGIRLSCIVQICLNPLQGPHPGPPYPFRLLNYGYLLFGLLIHHQTTSCSLPSLVSLCVSLVPFLGTWEPSGSHRELRKVCKHLLCHLATSTNLHTSIPPTFQIFPSSVPLSESQSGVESRSQCTSRTHQCLLTPSSPFPNWESSRLGEEVGIRVNYGP